MNNETRLFRIGDRDNWTCWICGQPVDKTLYWTHKTAAAGTPEQKFATDNAPSIDHINGRLQQTDGDLRLAHQKCNWKRG